MTKRFKIGSLTLGTFLLLSGLALFPSIGQNRRTETDTSDEAAIRTCITKYFQFAKEKDKVGVKALLSMTPAFYWDSDQSTLSENVKADTKDAPQSTAVPFGPLDDLAYSNLTESTFLVAGKASIDKNEIGPIIVNGPFAKAVVTLAFNGKVSKYKNDYMLQRKSGVWTIFRIHHHNPSDQFPNIGPRKE